MKKKEAIALIDEITQEPSIDELARRARATLAMAPPSESDMNTLVTYWRRERAFWGKGEKNAG